MEKKRIDFADTFDIIQRPKIDTTIGIDCGDNFIIFIIDNSNSVGIFRLGILIESH